MKFNTNFRFYFTAAQFTPLSSMSKHEVKKLVAGSRFTGMIEAGAAGAAGMPGDSITASKGDVLKEEGGFEEQHVTTKIIDTAGDKVKQEVLLVCLGDSKGYLHFNHIYIA